MAVRATVSRFPMDAGAHENSGIPWGVTVTPFATKDENGQAPAYGSGGQLLPRCENCWAYFNTYCELDQWSWNCALCGNPQGLSSEAIARYSHPQSCPEMMSSFVDLELPGSSLCLNFLIFWLCLVCRGSDPKFKLRICFLNCQLWFIFSLFCAVEDSDEAMQPRPVYVAAIDLSCKSTLLFGSPILPLYCGFVNDWLDLCFEMKDIVEVQVICWLNKFRPLGWSLKLLT